MASFPWYCEGTHFFSASSGHTFVATLLSFLITWLVCSTLGSHLGLSSLGWVAHLCKSLSYLRLDVQHLLTQEVSGQIHHVPHSQHAA